MVIPVWRPMPERRRGRQSGQAGGGGGGGGGYGGGGGGTADGTLPTLGDKYRCHGGAVAVPRNAQPRRTATPQPHAEIPDGSANDFQPDPRKRHALAWKVFALIDATCKSLFRQEIFSHSFPKSFALFAETAKAASPRLKSGQFRTVYVGLCPTWLMLGRNAGLRPPGIKGRRCRSARSCRWSITCKGCSRPATIPTGHCSATVS